ncbi:MAG TPA: hypothetical protein PKG77_25130 [Phycisphaerae bacterium]|nr:hypothetical protein [Phycisphaerae bacterium]HQL76258.1 hypothetical protein [Phycisphaerae bacterium]
MPYACTSNSASTVERVAQAIDAVMGIRVDDLERVVQEAHESDSKQIHDPEERFALPRQALRMFWHFRCNLEAAMPSRRE